jgi:hypothetical protein
VLEVLSQGRLDEWGKTEHSTQRRTTIPSLLQEDLAQWRSTLQTIGHPVRGLDFIPGDLAGPEHGARDPRTGACHFSENQARAWGQRFFTPAGPHPTDVEWRAARTEQAERQTLDNPPGTLGVSDEVHPRRKIRNWLDAHRRRTRKA